MCSHVPDGIRRISQNQHPDRNCIELTEYPVNYSILLKILTFTLPKNIYTPCET